MAIFSKGGTSYPDILVVCYLSTCCLISTILNPAVFLYNYRKKKNSVPVFLFKCLSVFDFFTCVVIPIKVINEAVKRECVIKQEDLMKRNNSCIWRIPSSRFNDEYHIYLRVYSLVHWAVFLTPNFIAAVMAICRFIQIKFPFFPLKIRHIFSFALMFGLYTSGLSSYVAFDRNSTYGIEVQVYKHHFGITEGLYLVILVYTWPSLISQVVSVFTSLLTIRHLCNIRKNPVSAVARRTVSFRSSVKILITNFGSVLNNILMIACMISTPRIFSDTESGLVSLFLTTVLAPVLMSCFNPVVFILFTPKFMLALKPISSS